MKGLLKMVGALREAFLSVEDRRGWVKEPVADAATFQDGLYVQVCNSIVHSFINKYSHELTKSTALCHKSIII